MENPTPMTRWTACLTLMGLLFLAACAVTTAPPRPPVATAEALLKKLQEDEANLQTLQAFGSLKWARGGEKGSVDHGVVIRRPDALRLEALAPMGPSLFSLVMRHGKVDLFAPSESKAYQGDASIPLMERLFALPMKPQEAITVLCGRVPLCPVKAVKRQTEAGLIVLDVTCEEEGWTQRVRLDPGTQDAVGFNVLGPSGEVVLSVNWGDFVEVGGIRVPGEVRAEMPLKGNSLTLRFREVEINTPIPEDRFQLRIPPGTDIQPLS